MLEKILYVKLLIQPFLGGLIWITTLYFMNDVINIWTGSKNFFIGHFPHFPVMPGVLIIEAMAQAGAYMMIQKAKKEGIEGDYTVLFAGIESAKFRKPVVPGDQIIFEVEGINIKKSMGKIKGVAKVDGKVVAEATLMAALKKA
jgi:3-hydroxyacyl-[acyl-carrier-protein] dehydratase